MASERYALIEPDGLVSNVVVWDGETPYRPDDVEVIPCPDPVGIGWRTRNGDWLPPVADEAQA